MYMYENYVRSRQWHITVQKEEKSQLTHKFYYVFEFRNDLATTCNDIFFFSHYFVRNLKDDISQPHHTYANNFILTYNNA